MPNPESTHDEKSANSRSIGSIRVHKIRYLVDKLPPSCERYTAYPGQDTRQRNPDPKEYVRLNAWRCTEFTAHTSVASARQSQRNDPNISVVFEAPLDTDRKTITSVLHTIDDKHSHSWCGKSVSVVGRQRQISAEPGCSFTLCAYPPDWKPTNYQECESLFPLEQDRASVWILKSDGVTLMPLHNEERSFAYVIKDNH